MFSYDADQEGSLGSMGRSWAERKVAHPQKLCRPSLSGLFSSVDSPDAPHGSARSSSVFQVDKSGMAPASPHMIPHCCRCSKNHIVWTPYWPEVPAMFVLVLVKRPTLTAHLHSHEASFGLC